MAETIPEMFSRIYMPEIYSFSSKDDETSLYNNDSVAGFYDRFRVILKTPVLNIKSIDFIRATFPVITTSIPDTELVFWYYRLPLQEGAVNAQPVPPDITYLHCVRIQPSYVPKEILETISYSVGQTYADVLPINRLYNSYQDLLGDLNKTTQVDVNNPYFIAGDITFGYDTTLKKFSFTGNNEKDGEGNLQFFYSYAGFNDPNIETASKILQQATTNNFGIQGLLGQPFYPTRDLNVRLGFIWDGQILSQNAYRNHIRPVPLYYLGGDTTVAFDTATFIAESYGDLVPTSAVYIYCNLIAGSGYDSTGRPSLLAIVPLNTGQLGVAFYQNTLNNPLLKVPREIYEVEFIFRTDTGDRFFLPDSAIVDLALKFNFIQQ